MVLVIQYSQDSLETRRTQIDILILLPKLTSSFEKLQDKLFLPQLPLLKLLLPHLSISMSVLIGMLVLPHVRASMRMLSELAYVRK
jgi:hypothetical protein